MANYLWKNHWLWPYESTWSIIKKFKYVNVLSGTKIKDIIKAKAIVECQEEMIHHVYCTTKYNITAVNTYFSIRKHHYKLLNILNSICMERTKSKIYLLIID